VLGFYKQPAEPEPGDAGAGKSAKVDATSHEAGDGPVILRVRVWGNIEPRTDFPLTLEDQNYTEDQLVGNLRQ
jgi:hypothetical protein